MKKFLKSISFFLFGTVVTVVRQHKGPIRLVDLKCAIESGFAIKLLAMCC